MVQETQKIENSHPACDCAMRPRVPILRVIFDVFEYQIMFNCSFFFPPVDDLLGCLRSLLFQIKYFIMYNILHVKYFCGDELKLRPRTKGPRSCLNRWVWPKDVNMSKEALGIKDNFQEQVLWRSKIATITKATYRGNKQGSSIVVYLYFSYFNFLICIKLRLCHRVQVIV